MDKLVTIFSKFISRDMLYIMGGASIIYVFSKLVLNTNPPKEISNIEYLIIAGFSYVIGFIVQEFFCMLNIVSTTPKNDSDWFSRLFYRTLTGEKLEDKKQNKKISLQNLYFEFLSKEGDSINYYTLDRIITLKQIGSTMFASWVTCLIIYVVIVPNLFETTEKLLGLSFAVLLLLILLIINRVKLYQQREYLLSWKNGFDNN